MPFPPGGYFCFLPLDVLSELTNTLRAVNKTSVPAILNKSPMVEMSRPLLILSLEINTQYRWLASVKKQIYLRKVKRRQGSQIVKPDEDYLRG